MKINAYTLLATSFMALSMLATGCSSTDTKTTDSPEQVATKPDMAQIKADIQALETDWATADNARDLNTVAAFYADDAVSMANNSPSLAGKAAIMKDIENSMAKREKGSTITFEVLEVFGDENLVTEVGRAVRKDASGKDIYAGKYMAIWEKRDGKYLCIRDINNDDAKPKP